MWPVGRTLQSFSESREDLLRLASFRRALKRGDTPEAAATWANRHHFDYGDLTETEVRALRRVMPFYTFMARNTPLQLASLIKSPGRFATLEKSAFAVLDVYEHTIIECIMKCSGVNELSRPGIPFASHTAERRQRNATDT